MNNKFRLANFAPRPIPATIKTLEKLDRKAIQAKRLCLDDDTQRLDLLGQFPQIPRMLFIGSKLDAATAKAFDQMKKCTEFGLFAARSIEGLVTIKGLEFLYFDACPGLGDLTAFAENKKLTSLYLEACLNITSLKGVENFSQLSEFSIIGGGVTSATLDSLESLKSLTKLRYLKLYAKVKDKTLAPLMALKNLEYVDMANRFRREEYEAILQNNPKLNSIELHNGVFDRNRGFVKDKD